MQRVCRTPRHLHPPFGSSVVIFGAFGPLRSLGWSFCGGQPSPAELAPNDPRRGVGPCEHEIHARRCECEVGSLEAQRPRVELYLGHPRRANVGTLSAHPVLTDNKDKRNEEHLKGEFSHSPVSLLPGVARRQPSLCTRVIVTEQLACSLHRQVNSAPQSLWRWSTSSQCPGSFVTAGRIRYSSASPRATLKDLLSEEEVVILTGCGGRIWVGPKTARWVQ